MTLYEMLDKSVYFQKVWVCETNAYDQNLILFKGIAGDARKDESVWIALMDKIEVYEFINGKLLIMCCNEHYEERLENQFTNPNWGKDKKDRPWRYSTEIYEEMRKSNDN